MRQRKLHPFHAVTTSAPSKRSSGKGFTLVETVVAVAITGIGIVSLMSVCTACTYTSNEGSKLTEAVMLGQEIRELTLRLPFYDPEEGEASAASPGLEAGEGAGFVDDLDDLTGVTFDVPRNGRGSPMGDRTGWSESITLTWIDPYTLASVPAGSSDCVWVDLNVSFRDQTLVSTGWVVVKEQG